MSDKLKISDYQALAEFRYRIRCFLRFSERAAREAGLEPQQHQLLLALKGLPEREKPTIGVIAERLQIKHHSAVELVDRLEEKGFVRRYRDKSDGRQVLVRITESAQTTLRDLSIHHLSELQSIGPELVRVLNTFLPDSSSERPRIRLQAANDP